MPSEMPTRKRMRAVVTDLFIVGAPVAAKARNRAHRRVVSDLGGSCDASLWVMNVALDPTQAETLREVLQSSLKQLRIEHQRADSRDYREMLHRRELVVEQLLSKLDEPIVH